MKKLFLFSVVLLLTVCAFAQVPNSFNYQAVARNNAGLALANQSIKVRLSVTKGANVLYSETRPVTTNLLGLFNVQIGSAGATTTSGDFTTISWFNTTPAVSLKVELDINNSNVFTDMGTQPFSTVPYAFAAKSAADAVNIGGRYVDPVTVPNIGDVLQWNGTAWTSFTLPAQPIAGSWGGAIQMIPFGSATAPWVFAGPTATVTVDGTQKIIATATGSLGHGNSLAQPCSFTVCWSLVAPGSPITAFGGVNYLNGAVLASNSTTGNRTNLTGTGVVTLPAGTYKIGFAVKNTSTSVNFGSNDFVNGSYMIIK